MVQRDKINVAVIDCNILSSIKGSAELIFRYIKDGGFLFVDDFYTNIGKGKMPVEEILIDAAAKYNRKLHSYKCYPPFARAFIVFSV